MPQTEQICLCESCIEYRKIRETRLSNRKWAIERLSNGTIKAVWIAGDHPCYSVRTLTNAANMHGQYVLFLLELGTVGVDLSNGMPDTFGGLYFGFADYDSLEMLGMQLERRGGENFYLRTIPAQQCEVCGNPGRNLANMGKYKTHAQCVRTHGYGAGNSLRIPTTHQKELPTFSFELELCFDSYSDNQDDYNEVLVQLLKEQFRRTSDGTVSDEMVSPIYETDKPFLHTMTVLDTARKYVTANCGTHIHTGLTEHPRDFYYGHREIFGALGDYLDNANSTKRIWGRELNQWCRARDGGRYMWLNFETGWPTVEYRLPVLTSARQFRRLVWFARVFTQEMRKVYNDHYRQRPSDGRWTTSEGAEHFINFYRRFEQYALKKGN